MRSFLRPYVLVCAILIASLAPTRAWAQRTVVDPGWLGNQILWTATETAKVGELGKIESSQREILRQDLAWRQAVGPSVANQVAASPIALVSPAPSSAAALLAKQAGSDTPYAAFADANKKAHETRAVLDAQTRTFAGDGRALDLSEWQQVRQQSAAQGNRVLLATAAEHDEVARAKMLLALQVTRQRAEAADIARAKAILQADFPP